MNEKIPELVFATHNPGKLRELKDMVEPLNIKVYSAADLHLIEPEEIADTFEENAIDKARFAALSTGKPALADDSGLVIPALNGAPGVYSARWGLVNPDGSRNFQPAYERIHRELGESSHEAYFYCVLALVLPTGKTYTFVGRADGHLTFPPRGTHGFGYDPIFVPLGETRTFAEMTMAEKKFYSARGESFRKFLKFLAQGCHN
jgi:XTP/dITP diphosphohydrolase